ncbi:MAG: pitrilysin family protein, partial [Polyangiales bacterium]
MRTKQMFAALCVALLITASAAAAPEPAAPLLSFERFTLPNGMRVVLHVDRKLPLVHVNLWYHVGSKNEPPGRTGFAHLFEHLMLQGSKNAPEDYFTLMARIGARGGRDSNGTTSTDRTNYFATAPSGSLDYLLWVHADLLATFPEALTQQKLDNQREVVRNERRQGIDNAPYGRWHKLLLEQLFPARHPYSWPIIGSHEDLQAARLDDVRAFFATYYTPNNLSLVVSGDFDPEEARRLVEKHFAAIAPGPALDRPRFDLPRLDREKVIEVRDRVALERVFIAFPTPQIGGEGERELELTAGILTDGLSSRLTKTLVHERKLCTS